MLAIRPVFSNTRRPGTGGSAAADPSVPILLKELLHPADAREAVKRGGGTVSNHAGRQVDGAVASLDALPAVAEAVAGRAVVLFDVGIRRGPTCSRRWPWGRGRCCWARRIAGGWRPGASRGCVRCCST